MKWTIVVLASVLTITATWAEEEGPLSVGVTGSTPDDPRRDPTTILAPVGVQRLMLRLAAEGPLTAGEIRALPGGDELVLQDAVAVGLLREEGGRYAIDFNLLTVEDQRRILDVAARLGPSLADAYAAREADWRRLAAEHAQAPGLTPELLYLVLGCFSLDWDGLDVTEELGYRLGAQRVIDDRAFTPWAKEKGAGISLRGFYWGSHNSTVEGWTLTSFGDHDALPRFGLPDVLWRSRHAFAAFEELPEERRAAGRLLSSYAGDAMADAARLMVALASGPRTTAELSAATGVDGERLDRQLSFLEGLRYVEPVDGRWRATVVVLTERDRALVDGMRAAGRELIVKWHEARYGEMREALADLTPIRAGVPFERVYTEVWHFVFGFANRALVERGLFADPYGEGRRHQGFVPLVWASDLVER